MRHSYLAILLFAEEGNYCGVQSGHRQFFNITPPALGAAKPQKVGLGFAPFGILASVIVSYIPAASRIISRGECCSCADDNRAVGEHARRVRAGAVLLGVPGAAPAALQALLRVQPLRRQVRPPLPLGGQLHR